MQLKTQTIDSWLRTHADHRPDSIALLFEGKDWSYAALSNWAARLAAHLYHSLGLRRGDRLAYYGKNSDAQVALMFAAAKLGVIFVPLNWRLEVAELAFLAADCAPKVLVHSAEFAAKSAQILDGLASQSVEVDSCYSLPEAASIENSADLKDPYLIVYTSGTTGRPKGAVMTQEAVLWNAIISQHAHDFTPQDHTLNLLPLFHVGGINIQMMPTFFVGGRVTLHAAFDPEMALRAMSEQGMTSTICVPTVMKALLSHPRWNDLEFPDFRLMNTGSTDVPVEILRAVQDRGIPMVQVYGATETGPITTYQKAAEATSSIGSIGRAGAHCQISLRRPDGSDCDVDEAGEIWVKGPNNFSSYWNEEEATKAALRDGWFKTGDIASRDKSGLYWFAGRSKHVIISGGENIYPAELERVLAQINGIAEAAVVGRPDPKWGEVPVAIVVASKDGPSKTEILAAFSEEIARFKHPKDVVFVDALPKNALGKTMIDAVRKLVTSVG